jgi:hypothetical protein
MDGNPFDQASRYLARRAGAPLMHWLLGCGPGAMRFSGWLDTQLTVPGQPERTCDTIARVVRLDQGGLPWAIPVEFQTETDPAMFGRALVYMGLLYQQEKPSPERGDRFAVVVVVVNLTGTGRSGRQFVWREQAPETSAEEKAADPEAGADQAPAGRGPCETTFLPEEWNFAGVSAGEVLDAVARDEAPRLVLAWIPLMQGGDDPAIIARWLEAAGQESDPQVKADLGLARVFAEAADRRAVWSKALEGFNVIRSRVVEEWKAEAKQEGEMEGTVKTLLRVLRRRFGDLPSDVEMQIRGTTDRTLLDQWTDLAATAASLDDFRSGLNG